MQAVKKGASMTLASTLTKSSTQLATRAVAGNVVAPRCWDYVTGEDVKAVLELQRQYRNSFSRAEFGAASDETESSLLGRHPTV